MEKAVIDRIDEGLAVLLVGEEERELVAPLAKLPKGAQAGDWLKVALVQGQIAAAELDVKGTARRRARIQAKMDQVFKRPRDS